LQVVVVLLVAGFDPAIAQNNPGYNLVGSMSDYEGAHALSPY